MIVELIAIALIVACWVIGGQIKGRIRDVPVPIIIGTYFAFKGVWWLFFALGATYQVIRIGWGNYSPEDDDHPSHLADLTRDRNGWWIRAIWGFLASFIGAFPLVKWGFINAWSYAGYIALNTVVNFLVSRLRLPVLITDILVALALGSIVFLK